MQNNNRQELQTLRDLIRYAVSRLNAARVALGHGSDNAWDEAVYLVLHGLHLPPDTLDPFLDARVLPSERSRVLDLIDRRVTERLPAAYLTGEAWLRGHRFHVDRRVIVPRSPIAELLDEGLAPWVRDPLQVERALDMCTGSGCLAILAALAFPVAQVDAVDVSSDALEVAARNVAEYGLQDRLTLRQGNLFEALPAAAYDVIVCNPPYVNQASMDALPRNTATSRRWRWPAAPMAWIWCAASWPRPPATCPPTACWCWKSATSAIISRRPSLICSRYGWTPRNPRTRFCCLPANN
ncbi:adenine-specific methylase [Bordetella parapertussis]|nr:adenine-specific methylase [Bordetella parapertussis]